jgi:asparagine synthase (glutamine-hydrolysing)
MNVGFTVFVQRGEVEFHLCDHRHKDRPPLVAQATAPGARLVLMGRLYYHADLRAGLNQGTAEPESRAEDGDAALALVVYRQRGLEGLERLEGDFALVIWDAGKQRLIAMRDPTGGYPIFYTVRSGAVLASTHMGPLLDSPASHTLNQEYLADYLMSSGVTLEESADGRTVYQGIHRVLSGSIVVFHLPGAKMEQRRYWDWPERQVDPGTDDVAKLGEQYLARLRAAVRARLRGRSASHVSGGMDSSGVALIARDCLQGREPLHALSLVYDRLPLLAREQPYLEGALRQPGLTPHRVNADEILDFDSFDAAPAHDEPFAWLFRLGVEEALTAAAARAGAATVMTGLGADEMLDMRPFHLTELLRSGRLQAAWREASRWARADNLNVWALLGPFGFANLQPAWMRMGLGNWLRGGYAPWGRQTEWTIAPWIRPDFARRMGLRERGLANLRRDYYGCRPVGLSLTLSGIRQSCDDFSRWYLAAPNGMMLTHPFRDPRVLSLGVGIQSRVRPRPGARKPILVAAMRGILPECILNRPSKGDFDEIYYRGLSRNLRSLEALVEQAPVDELGILDKASLLDCLQRAALGNARDARALSPLNGTLSLLLWLTRRQQDGRQHSQPTASPRERLDVALRPDTAPGLASPQ